MMDQIGVDLSESPALHEDYEADCACAVEFLARLESVIAKLPARAERSPEGQSLADQVHQVARRFRRKFLELHAEQLYAELTKNRHDYLRIEDLVYLAAELIPGLLPTRDQISDERSRPQADKEGREIDQGIFFWSVLRAPLAGEHLLQAMRRPTEQATALLPAFRESGVIDLGVVSIHREAGVAHLTLDNHRFLNAEDDLTVGQLETAVDLALLDDSVRVGVLRGAPMSHARYADRRVFSAGINLTHLHGGQISFVDFLLRRELGYINKIFRGIAFPDVDASPTPALEKPWIGAVDTFCIGGGTQITLVLDQVIAERGSYFTLPALQEGIIPGAANLRLTRMVGSRLARQLIYANRPIAADSAEGRLLCDSVVDAERMDEAIRDAALLLAEPAVISNRRVLHRGEEPEALFREYMASYALEQSERLYSSDMVANLERTWIARRR